MVDENVIRLSTPLGRTTHWERCMANFDVISTNFDQFRTSFDKFRRHFNSTNFVHFPKQISSHFDEMSAKFRQFLTIFEIQISTICSTNFDISSTISDYDRPFTTFFNHSRPILPATNTNPPPARCTLLAKWGAFTPKMIKLLFLESE